MKTQITKNFTLEEMTHSNTAVANGIKNIPNKEQIGNLETLAIKLLQPLRDIYGKPMAINSGFRNPQVNKLVGGVATSHHLVGKAADIRVDNPRRLQQELIKSGLDFDQAILYDDGRNYFLHLSYNEGRNRRQVLYSKGTKP
jgi:uncharacterized protein YcbK (DUF882 family)